MTTLNIGIIGLGTVGTGLIEALEKNKQLITQKYNLNFNITKIGVKNLTKKRPLSLDKSLLTTDALSVATDSKNDIIIELIGGTSLAYEIVKEALKNNKIVVTANKALIATYGLELFKLAKKHNSFLFFEASVAGGIPIIQVLNQSLLADDINSVHAILNGTCNFILSKMQNGYSFENALKEAQEQGYAEADPSLDIDGVDTAHKATILASLIHNNWFDIKNVDITGIRNISPIDIKLVKKANYTIKLIASIKKVNNMLYLNVSPTLILENTMLAATNNAYNAIRINSNMAQDTIYYGLGAGKNATASAVASDLIQASLTLKDEQRNHLSFNKEISLLKKEDSSNRYYLRLYLQNKADCLSAISHILGENNINIASIYQEESEKSYVPVFFITEKCLHKNILKVIEQLKLLPLIKQDEIIIYPVES